MRSSLQNTIYIEGKSWSWAGTAGAATTLLAVACWLGHEPQLADTSLLKILREV